MHRVGKKSLVLFFFAVCLGFQFHSEGWAQKDKQTKNKRKRPKIASKKRLKKVRFRFPFAGIRLPSDRHSDLSPHLKKLRPVAPNPEDSGRKRRRPPTRKIRTMGALPLRTAPVIQDTPPTVRRRMRAPISVRSSATQPKGVRLVVYRRWLGRRGWIRRWLGHISLSSRHRLTYYCLLPLSCRLLRREVESLRLGVLRSLPSTHPSFLWRLRKDLERTLGYEVEVQRYTIRPAVKHLPR